MHVSGCSKSCAELKFAHGSTGSKRRKETKRKGKQGESRFKEGNREMQADSSFSLQSLLRLTPLPPFELRELAHVLCHLPGKITIPPFLSSPSFSVAFLRLAEGPCNGRTHRCYEESDKGLERAGLVQVEHLVLRVSSHIFAPHMFDVCTDSIQPQMFDLYEYWDFSACTTVCHVIAGDLRGCGKGIQ